MSLNFTQAEIEQMLDVSVDQVRVALATDWFELKTELDSARAQLSSANEALIGKHKRDMFAAAALTACIPMLDQSDAYIATRAFEIAEAMLVESAKRAKQL